uniref:(northern house mosquito) hypothetical protein n=1 Tax=Culex pipiens TaxID=7175 RepID=A0A8D8C1K2_CULPI
MEPADAQSASRGTHCRRSGAVQLPKLGTRCGKSSVDPAGTARGSRVLRPSLVDRGQNQKSSNGRDKHELHAAGGDGNVDWTGDKRYQKLARAVDSPVLRKIL